MNWKARYQRLNESAKQEMHDHLDVCPVELRLRPFWKRLLMSPVLIWKHFWISYRGGSAWWFALKLAWDMNYTMLFWRGDQSR